MLDKIIVIVGPTAVGKTSLGIQLAQRFNGEIISGDSMQIYKGLSIGTAKATPAEQAQAVHHLIDIAEPTEHFSAAQFVKLARQAIDDVISRGKLPIIVGGTGFYIQALLGDRPLADLPVEPTQEETDAWIERAKSEGEAVVRDELRAIDPVSAERILPGQLRRLVRALLISQQAGQPFSSLQPEPKREYDAFIIGLNTERTLLYNRINQRVDLMIESGLLEEAQTVLDLPTDTTAKMSIGYKELFPYLRGETDLATSTEELRTASRRYAKRQLTWFNNQFADIHWFDLVQQPEQVETIKTEIKKFMS